MMKGLMFLPLLLARLISDEHYWIIPAKRRRIGSDIVENLDSLVEI
jgi:hypothetical protein